MNDTSPTLPEGTYTKAGIYQDHTITVQLEGGRPILGTMNGEPMTGTFWQGVILLDLARLPHTFTPAPSPSGRPAPAGCTRSSLAWAWGTLTTTAPRALLWGARWIA